MKMPCLLLVATYTLAFAEEPHPHAAPGVTSLTNPKVKYTTPRTHAIVLKRGDVRAVIVDNAAVDNSVLTKHRAGYNGVASLTHKRQKRNIFVERYAGLNFEHIHDGTLEGIAKEKFAPRKSPMQLRRIDEFTVEVYQPPDKVWKLESCGRYRLLKDGSIEYTFECIPRAKSFKNGYIGLFWASYIDSPKDKAIHFFGREKSADAMWFRSVTPKHGTDATHPPAGLKFDPRVRKDFPLTLVTGRSGKSYVDPWYYGVCRGMGLAYLFRTRDQIWFAQSPTGGGATNPAWDFQWFVPNYKVGKAYGFVMRLAYIPATTRKKLERETQSQRRELNKHK